MHQDRESLETRSRPVRVFDVPVGALGGHKGNECSVLILY